MKTQSTVGLALVFAISAGCGGSSDPAGTTTAGTVQTSGGGGEAVSQEAQNRWTDGLTGFRAAETGGWNASRCETVTDDFDAAVEAQGNFAEALYMAGLVRQRCGKGGEAAPLFMRALSANSKLCAARVALGLVYLDQGRTPDARAAFQQSVTDDTQCTEGYVNLASIQRKGNEGAEALNNLRRALAIESSYLPAFNEMALLYLDQAQSDPQKLDLAGVVCRQAQQINDSWAPIYNTWGLITLRKNNVVEALKLFNRAVSLDPKFFEAYMNFGQITLNFRGYDDSQQACSKAVELNEGSYDAHICLGAALRGLRRLDEAQTQYQRAVAIDANRPEAYFNLGLIFQDYMSGQPDDLRRADEQYQQFLAKAGTDPKYAATVQEVSRSCDIDRNQRRRRRARSTDCRPGRRQNIQITIDALREAAQMQAEAARLQEQADEQARREAAQQPPAPPPPEPTPVPAGGAAAPPAVTEAAGGATPAAPAAGAAAAPASN